MRQTKKKRLFKRNETGYHRQAVNVLAKWLKGKKEVKFYDGDSILFVPDVTCYKNGILNSFYEVVYSHPLKGTKLGLMQYWCYRNSTEVSVFEVSADYILAQTSKPKIIQTMECYVIDPFELPEVIEEFEYKIA